MSERFEVEARFVGCAPSIRLAQDRLHPTYNFSLRKTLAVFIGTPPLATIVRVASNPADEGD